MSKGGAKESPYIISYRYNAATLTVYRIMNQRQSIDTYSLIEY